MVEEEKEKNKNQRAKEIAKIMVENIKANMADPEFWEKRERIRQEAADKVLIKRREKQNSEKK